jgi:hypothetical protein
MITHVVVGLNDYQAALEVGRRPTSKNNTSRIEIKITVGLAIYRLEQRNDNIEMANIGLQS